MKHITLNGNAYETQSITISELLAALGFASKPVVVEYNQRALFPREFSEHLIENHAKIEIVVLAAGG